MTRLAEFRGANLSLDQRTVPLPLITNSLGLYVTAHVTDATSRYKQVKRKYKYYSRLSGL